MTPDICNSCLQSDCSCICDICQTQQPEHINKSITTRTRKSAKIDWISCNHCKKWFHPICTGLTKKEFKTINSSTTIENYFFKCLKCNLKSALIAGIEIQKIYNPAESKNKNKVKNTVNISTQTEQQLQHHNREQSISNSKQTQTSENRESKIAQQDSNTNSENIQQIDITVGPTKETEPITNKNISNTKTISEELKELRETATTTFVNNTNTNINPKNIRIIDNIPPNLQPKSSSDIKKRIKEYTKEEITVDYTYILPKGGIVIQLASTADIDKLEQELNNIYPGSICNPPKSQLNIKKVIIKNIEPNIQLEDLTNEIKTTFPDCTKIRRFQSPIICITSINS